MSVEFLVESKHFQMTIILVGVALVILLVIVGKLMV